MQFLPELKTFLLSRRVIYTVRGYNMSDKDVYVEGVGWCHRTPMGVVRSFDDLAPFVLLSGFSTLEDWVGKIRAFIPVGRSAWLYRVTLVGNLDTHHQ